MKGDVNTPLSLSVESMAGAVRRAQPYLVLFLRA